MQHGKAKKGSFKKILPFWCRLESSLGERVSPSCWHYIADARLFMATMTVARLAFAIPECPQRLLVHLEHLMARATSPVTKDVKPQHDRQNEISQDVTAGCGMRSRSTATWQQRQIKNAEAQKRHISKAFPSGCATWLSGHSSIS